MSQADKDSVIRVAQQVIEQGGWYVRVYQDSLTPFYSPGSSRGDVETRYRNFCLARLRDLGFEHQLIVDGDELYLPGALAALDWSVRWFKPTTAGMRGVPLVGIPAVAVEGATDRILGYIGGQDHWRNVRSPTQPMLDIDRIGVLHFSGVRRTREEIAEKMRKSGHYDDPDYDFEGWIYKTLPNLAPGQSNVHMYRDGSLWPRSRELTDAERAAIPPALWDLLWRTENVQSA